MKSIAWFFLVGLGVAAARSETAQNLPAYRPQVQISDTLRSWGSVEMAPLLKAWEAGFKHVHPEVRFADVMKGSDTAQAALYADVADLGLMDRKILFVERHVMLRRKHRLPLEITVATGSPVALDRTFALAVFVHKDNPIARLTLKQLDGIFGEQRTGAWDDKFRWQSQMARRTGENIRTWGQLGLTGEWADKPIQVYGFPVTSYSINPDVMLCFRTAVFKGADMWNPNLREYPNGADITAALSKDRYGIAYAGLAQATPEVKVIALGVEGGDWVQLTPESVANRKYPLTRSVYIYIDPGQLENPKVKEFLTYVLSRDGQAVVAQEGGYVPLTAAEASVQREKLTAKPTSSF
jgi:phosphate transport system substrate-binding protein